MYANQKGEFTCRKQEWGHKKYKEMNWSFIIISSLRYSINVTYLMSVLGLLCSVKEALTREFHCFFLLAKLSVLKLEPSTVGHQMHLEHWISERTTNCTWFVAIFSSGEIWKSLIEFFNWCVRNSRLRPFYSSMF